MVIEKKQYMGDRTLKSFIVPKDVVEIGDWAFSGCKELRWVAIPESVEHIGRNVFAFCEKLEAVYCYQDTVEKKEESLAELMAIAFRFFRETSRMIEMWRKGRGAWICAWDQVCKRFLEGPDEEGFHPFLAGGEEDYQDEEEDRREYCRKKRLQKAEVILKRLLVEREWEACQMSEKEKAFWLDKLRENDMALELLKDNVNKPMQVVDIYENAGLLTHENCRILLETIPEESVELRAMLLGRTTCFSMDSYTL